eukprot:scaffold277338_cov29-Tisochrysis_lutea.AAC.3
MRCHHKEGEAYLARNTASPNEWRLPRAPCSSCGAPSESHIEIVGDARWAFRSLPLMLHP